MGKSYYNMRIPGDIFHLYKGIKLKMEDDLKRLTGKPLKMTWPKVFRAVASPEINRNYIEIHMKDLVDLAKKRRGKDGK